jgi:Peptidase family M28
MKASLARWTLVIAAGVCVCAQQPPQIPPGSRPVGVSVADDEYLRWPLPPNDQAYGAIDGKHLHEYVVEQANISRRYRDQGHPKFWGRIIGTSSDQESAAWLAGKFKAIGLTDVRIQALDLAPQWMPRSWSVSATGGGKTIELDSAQPYYRANTTPPGGVDVDAAYVGLGSEADFVGRDVNGKAAVVFTMLGLKPEQAPKRADAKGAKVILSVDMLPGNMRFQEYPSGTQAPAFTIGSDDGYALRDMIASAPAGQPARVRASLDVQMVSNLKTSLVWGTLPGATDETIYIMAHRDGWFDAAGDNAGGVASMLGLAEHFAKVPRAERRRTIVFIGLDGHHNSGEGAAVGGRWIGENKDKLFAKTALVINCEHPSTVQSFLRPRYEDARGLVRANTFMAQQWYAGGTTRPELQAIASRAFREFGAPMYREANVRPPLGDLGRVFQFAPGVATSEFSHYFHTDQETPETVPWTGLEALTRAYAKIVAEVNKLPLTTLQRQTGATQQFRAETTASRSRRAALARSAGRATGGGWPR